MLATAAAANTARVRHAMLANRALLSHRTMARIDGRYLGAKRVEAWLIRSVGQARDGRYQEAFLEIYVHRIPVYRRSRKSVEHVFDCPLTSTIPEMAARSITTLVLVALILFPQNIVLAVQNDLIREFFDASSLTDDLVNDRSSRRILLRGFCLNSLCPKENEMPSFWAKQALEGIIVAEAVSIDYLLVHGSCLLARGSQSHQVRAIHHFTHQYLDAERWEDGDLFVSVYGLRCWSGDRKGIRFGEDGLGSIEERSSSQS